MKLNDVFPSKYIKAADLQGGSPTVEISDAQIEQLGDDRKLVIYFKGKQKGLVCNRTNADAIAYLYGDDTDGWIGKKIMLTSQLVSFQGKTTPAIRVQPPKQNGSYVERDGYSINEPPQRQQPRQHTKDGLEEVLEAGEREVPF